jgi:hypothetical protein
MPGQPIRSCIGLWLRRSRVRAPSVTLPKFLQISEKEGAAGDETGSSGSSRAAVDQSNASSRAVAATMCHVVGEGAAYDPGLREAHLTAQTGGAGLRISAGLIREKIANSWDTLGILPPSPTIDMTIDKLEAMLGGLYSALSESIEALLLAEAQVAYSYLAAWQILPLRWKVKGRKPITLE